LKAWPRLTVPPGRTRKRFLALLLVFILGIWMLLYMYLVRCRQKTCRLVDPERMQPACADYALQPSQAVASSGEKGYCVTTFWLLRFLQQTDDLYRFAQSL
jgi:hypothetical protein